MCRMSSPKLLCWGAVVTVAGAPVLCCFNIDAAICSGIMTIVLLFGAAIGASYPG